MEAGGWKLEVGGWILGCVCRQRLQNPGKAIGSRAGGRARLLGCMPVGRDWARAARHELTIAQLRKWRLLWRSHERREGDEGCVWQSAV